MGRTMVAACVRERWPGATGEETLAMADVGDRGVEYGTGKAVDNMWWLWQICRGWIRDKNHRMRFWDASAPILQRLCSLWVPQVTLVRIGTEASIRTYLECLIYVEPRNHPTSTLDMSLMFRAVRNIVAILLQRIYCITHVKSGRPSSFVPFANYKRLQV